MPTIIQLPALVQANVVPGTDVLPVVNGGVTYKLTVQALVNAAAAALAPQGGTLALTGAMTVSTTLNVTGLSTLSEVTATTSVTSPILKAPTNGNVIIQSPAGVTIATFNGSTGLFTAPFNARWVGYLETTEGAAPAAPAANGVRLYAQDNGAGKTQLMALFSSGAAQQVAIQP